MARGDQAGGGWPLAAGGDAEFGLCVRVRIRVLAFQQGEGFVAGHCAQFADGEFAALADAFGDAFVHASGLAPGLGFGFGVGDTFGDAFGDDFLFDLAEVGGYTHIDELLDGGGAVFFGAPVGEKGGGQRNVADRFRFAGLPGDGDSDGIAQPGLRQRDGDLPVQIPMQRNDGDGGRRGPEAFAFEVEPAGGLGLGFGFAVAVGILIAVVGWADNRPPLRIAAAQRSGRAPRSL